MYEDWNDTLKIKHPVIDDEHKILINIFSEYRDLLISHERSNQKLEILFQKINHFITLHFIDEEKIMDSFPYKGGNNHKEIHKVMLKNVEFFIELFTVDPASFDHSHFLVFLQQWIVYHIKLQDSKMISELNKYQNKMFLIDMFSNFKIYLLKLEVKIKHLIYMVSSFLSKKQK